MTYITGRRTEYLTSEKLAEAVNSLSKVWSESVSLKKRHGLFQKSPLHVDFQEQLRNFTCCSQVTVSLVHTSDITT